MKKRWIVSSILVGLLAAGLAGGAVLAQSDGDGAKVTERKSKEGVRDEVMGRVAEILGIEQSALESAFDQAITEQAEREAAEVLASLVEKGILTQDQADAFQAWLTARPDGDFPVVGALGAFGRGFHGKGPEGLGEERAESLLAALVEEGDLTQEQANAYKTWLDDMPEVDLPALRPEGQWDKGRSSMARHDFGEQAEQAVANMLARLVEMGLLTQDQADAYQAWLDDRPEGALTDGDLIGKWSGVFLNRGLSEFSEEKFDNRLSALVEEGDLTQEQADAYKTWLDDMPEIDFQPPAFKGHGSWGDGFRDKEGHGFGDKR